MITENHYKYIHRGVATRWTAQSWDADGWVYLWVGLNLLNLQSYDFLFVAYLKLGSTSEPVLVAFTVIIHCDLYELYIALHFNEFQFRKGYGLVISQLCVIFLIST